MALSPMVAWAREHGLVTTGKKSWAIELRILTSDDEPTAVSSRTGTELWMRIADDHYWVDFQLGGDRFSCCMFKGAAEPKYTSHDFDLPVPELATFDRWFADLEARFRITFPRKRMWIKSNIKGGRDVMVAWIERGFVRTASAPKPARRRSKA